MSTIELPDLTAMTPAEIDTLWVEVLQPAIAFQRDLISTQRDIRRYEKAHYAVPSYLTERAAKQLAKFEEARSIEKPFQAEFTRRGGWQRYELVANSNGHLHLPWCHTITPGQTFVIPVPEVSGMDQEQVIEKMGSTACTKCFPNAPVVSAADDAAKAAAEGFCPEKSNMDIRTHRYADCKTCGAAYVSRSPSGLMRKHKTPEAVAAAEAAKLAAKEAAKAERAAARVAAREAAKAAKAAAKK